MKAGNNEKSDLTEKVVHEEIKKLFDVSENYNKAFNYSFLVFFEASNKDIFNIKHLY